VNPAAACLVDTASSQSFATVSAVAAVPSPPSAALNAGPATCAADAAPKLPITAAGPEHPPLSPEWLAAFLEEFKDDRRQARPLPTNFGDKLEAAKAEFLQLERDGIPIVHGRPRYGAEAGRVLAAMRRLQEAEHCHSTGRISFTKYGVICSQGSWVQGFQ